MVFLFLFTQVCALIPPFQYVEERHISIRLLQRENHCASDYTSCPASLGDGCCAKDFECITGGCRSVDTACGVRGYTNCGSASRFDLGMAPLYLSAQPTKRYLVPGKCCPEDYVCGGDSQCSPTTSGLSGGLTTNPAIPAITSYVTVAAAQPSTTPGDGSLAPKYIGAIVAGAVAFILTIALAVWSIKRHLNKVMRAVNNRTDLKQVPPTGDKVVGSERVTESLPEPYEVHGLPIIGFMDSTGQSSMSPDHRWELGGSYDAHGTSELEVNEVASTDDQRHKHINKSAQPTP
ncbi:hypothetical protein PG984_003471 [Apiospora sp. TS-2023a]